VKKPKDKADQAKPPKAIGRPSSFTQQKADIICSRLANGESLRTICRDEDMPDAATVYAWLMKDDAFLKQYERARELQADTLADETLEIADDARNDWMAREGEGNAGWQMNGEHVQRSRLRIDQRKWMAGKLRPKKYGDKLELAGDTNAPLIVRLTTHFPEEKK
jgi:hypothetical protein